MSSSVGTTELLKPNYANVEKNGDNDDHRRKYVPSGLVMLLIALVVVFLIAVILIAFAYQRYRRNRPGKKNVNLTMVKSYPKTDNGTVATETQTPASPVRTPSPKKPARASLKQDKSRISYDNVLLDVSQGKFVSQSDQFVPGTRDDVSWNLPFIDASREFLDNLDETQPVTKRTTVIPSEHEANDINLGQPRSSVHLDDNVSESHSKQDMKAIEMEPMLKTDEEDDDIFDDNIDCHLPRSPSEQIDLLFRMSLSGEND